MPVLTAGMLHAVKRLGDEGTFEIGDPVSPASGRNTGGLIMVGVIYMAGWLVIGLVVMVLVGGSMAGGIMAGAGGHPGNGRGISLGGIFVGLVLSLLLGAPLLMAVWFAPTLVHFNDMPRSRRVKASFSANLKNWLVILVFGLIVLVLSFFAALPMGLGFLVLMPVLFRRSTRRKGHLSCLT